MIRQKCEDLVAVSRYITNVEMIRQKCEDLVAVSRVYKSFPDFTGQQTISTGQQVWWTGKICLANHNFTRPTPYGKKRQRRTIISFKFKM